MNMISADDLPEDNEDLIHVRVSFPRLSEDSKESCPASMADILEYLHMESPDGEEVTAERLSFLRTALVGRTRYWIWRLQESDGADCYVTVAVAPDETTTIGYGENDYDLSPEQFMLGDYYERF